MPIETALVTERVSIKLDPGPMNLLDLSRVGSQLWGLNVLDFLLTVPEAEKTDADWVKRATLVAEDYAWNVEFDKIHMSSPLEVVIFVNACVGATVGAGYGMITLLQAWQRYRVSKSVADVQVAASKVVVDVLTKKNVYDADALDDPVMLAAGLLPRVQKVQQIER